LNIPVDDVPRNHNCRAPRAHRRAKGIENPSTPETGQLDASDSSSAQARGTGAVSGLTPPPDEERLPPLLDQHAQAVARARTRGARGGGENGVSRP